jgi:hypothetical protein
VGCFASLSGQSRAYSDDKDIQERISTARFYFHGKLDGRLSTIEVAEEIL